MAQIRHVYEIYMKSSDFYILVQKVAKIWQDSFFFLFSYSFSSQIWLNNNVINCQWSYIKTLRGGGGGGKKKRKKI